MNKRKYQNDDSKAKKIKAEDEICVIKCSLKNLITTVSNEELKIKMLRKFKDDNDEISLATEASLLLLLLSLLFVKIHVKNIT